MIAPVTAGPAPLLWRLAAYDLVPHAVPNAGTVATDVEVAAPAARPLAAEPLPPLEFSRLLAQANHHRIPGVLLAAVLDEALPVTEEQRAAVGQLHRESCVSVLGLERRLLAVVATLENAGITPVVLKGTAHAHLLYPDPALRHFGDLDLLVRSDELDAAVAVLVEQRGAAREVAQLRPGFDRRFAKGVTLVDDGIELDLHRTLLFGTFAFAIDPDELFDDLDAFEVGGRTLYALGPEQRLVHACLHAGLGDPQPRANSLRDLGWMLTQGEVDPELVVSLAGRWRCLGVVARGLSLCRTHLGVAGPPALEEACRAWTPTLAERRAIDSYVGPNRSHAAKVRASLPFLPRMRDRAAFVAGSLVPTRSFVRERQAGRLAWVRRGVRSLRR